MTRYAKRTVGPTPRPSRRCTPAPPTTRNTSSGTCSFRPIARTPTPTVARFKKGAFHLAMQAGVPMVPIVIRNAGELMWLRSMVINPGTVDVAVLEPIPTDDWTIGDLDARVVEVRQKFVDTLDDWPINGEVS